MVNYYSNIDGVTYASDNITELMNHMNFSGFGSQEFANIFAISFFAFLMILLIGIGLYIYSSFAFMKIGKKTKQKNPEIAWIPIVGKPLLASRIAKMHWWPLLLLVLFFIPIVNFFAIVVFLVFVYIWYWKMFEAVGKPGWWILLTLIPIFGGILFYIFIGLAAWKK